VAVRSIVAKQKSGYGQAANGTYEYEPTGRRSKDKRPAGWLWAGIRSSEVAQRLSGDQTVENIARSAVDETMRAMESEMQCKVRKGGPEEDRGTGELLYSKFFHRDSRPIEGLSDPHWQVHCLKRNAGIERDRCERFSGEAACRYSRGQAHYTLRRKAQNFAWALQTASALPSAGLLHLFRLALRRAWLQWLCRQLMLLLGQGIISRPGRNDPRVPSSQLSLARRHRRAAVEAWAILSVKLEMQKTDLAPNVP
jgi:TrwC relaxase